MQQNLNALMQNHCCEKILICSQFGTSHLGSAYKVQVTMHCTAQVGEFLCILETASQCLTHSGSFLDLFRCAQQHESLCLIYLLFKKCTLMNIFT